LTRYVVEGKKKKKKKKGRQGKKKRHKAKEIARCGSSHLSVNPQHLHEGKKKGEG